MFRFFRKKHKQLDAQPVPTDAAAPTAPARPPATETVTNPAPLAQKHAPALAATESSAPVAPTPAEPPPATPAATGVALPQADTATPAAEPAAEADQDTPDTPPDADTAVPATELPAEPEVIETPRTGWLGKLRRGLRKTGHAMDSAFADGPINDTLYDELEMALLMADAGVEATRFLIDDLKQRVKKTRARHASQARELLREAIADMLAPLEKTLDVGLYHPTVIIIAGVNGAGKTTSIGKLTRHLADAGAHVLLAAADTFRAAAREQLQVWAGRNEVAIISQQGADPAAVSFDAVGAGRARDMDVVLIDTAGRLSTQKNLMQELAKIRRVVNKADFTAPHEVLLVIDGNTGQNALAQVKAFGDALGGLTGLIVTKLDGTAKGGVLCAIAREQPVPVYFIGVGEQLEDLQTFRAREFAEALV